MDYAILGLVIAVVGQSALIWYKLGSLERAVKKACPFGICPVFKRAQEEAAPQRSG